MPVYGAVREVLAVDQVVMLKTPRCPVRYAAHNRTEFAFADVRRALAMTLDGEGFGLDCPPTGKPSVNPLIAAVLRLLA